MKISKRMVSAGALLLGVTAVFATIPRKMFSTFQVTFGITCLSGNFIANTSCFTTNTSSGHKVQLKTSGGSLLGTLVTTTFGSPVYFK